VKDIEKTDRLSIKWVEMMKFIYKYNLSGVPLIISEWFSFGKNHRQDAEFMLRELEFSGYVVDIPDLESLIEFRDKYGVIVLTKDGALEIYDDYRE
jgi:hypothetical protein